MYSYIFFVPDVVDGFTRKPATRVSLIGHQYQPSIQIENSSSQNFLSTTEILDKDFEAKANRTSFYLFQDEMGSTNSNGSRRSSHIFTMNGQAHHMFSRFLNLRKNVTIFLSARYRKVASSRPVYYSILNSFGQRSQYISIKYPLHKPSENPCIECY